MFHAGLNRLYGCGNTFGRPAVEEEKPATTFESREFERIRQERMESMQRRYARFVESLDENRREFPEYADRFDQYDDQASLLYNDYMEAFPFMTNQSALGKMHQKTLTGINNITNTVVHFIVMVARPAKQARQDERERRAAAGYVPEDASNRISGAGYNGGL
jgi:hypothetical protein